ncbi:MAG: LysM peptidoglycan-binding domain-containing protein [Planctomycetota bacterium]|nr:MAG: LysM peptidoglycan-binding domain-containing protein [Planctomycetota bacterium]
MGVKHVIGLVGIVVIFVLAGIVYDLQNRSEASSKPDEEQGQTAAQKPDVRVVQGTVPSPPPVPDLPTEQGPDNPMEAPPAGTADNSAITASAQPQPENNATAAAPDRQPSDPRPVRQETRKYTVQPGDNLYAIARKMYGDSSKWKLIFNANRNLIKDKNNIQRGWVLTIPPAGAKAAAAARSPKPSPRPVQVAYSYTVQPGDTFESIAEKVLKDRTKARTIKLLNRERIARLPDPDKLPPGFILEVPRMSSGN